MKISQVLRRVNGTIPQILSFYRARLDEIFGIFGEDRLLYGSDWPNSDKWRPLNVGLGLVSEYFNTKGRTVAEKYFWRTQLMPITGKSVNLHNLSRAREQPYDHCRVVLYWLT
ncbi:amidohydrolase family protein [Larkinella punicea]|uniref:amidohydrolase family protein n=1 Tax=Larkinella punicea TaxID=2315727 RepID=UPI001E516CF2|nr:amidohydrolase family protein [Larkinella punicea]